MSLHFLRVPQESHAICRPDGTGAMSRSRLGHTEVRAKFLAEIGKTRDFPGLLGSDEGWWGDGVSRTMVASWTAAKCIKIAGRPLPYRSHRHHGWTVRVTVICTVQALLCEVIYFLPLEASEDNGDGGGTALAGFSSRARDLGLQATSDLDMMFFNNTNPRHSKDPLFNEDVT
ncbi:hypothetical protein J6590_091396 [Homalodisca vitripennis]|nr:hypothetical protein J6590_091396 [Homalodisca vitripennis]